MPDVVFSIAHSGVALGDRQRPRQRWVTATVMFVRGEQVVNKKIGQMRLNKIGN